MVLGVQSIQQERVKFKTYFCSIPFFSAITGSAIPFRSKPGQEPPGQREGDAGINEGLGESTFPPSWAPGLPGMKKAEL